MIGTIAERLLLSTRVTGRGSEIWGVVLSNINQPQFDTHCAVSTVKVAEVQNAARGGRLARYDSCWCLSGTCYSICVRHFGSCSNLGYHWYSASFGRFSVGHCRIRVCVRRCHSLRAGASLWTRARHLHDNCNRWTTTGWSRAGALTLHSSANSLYFIFFLKSCSRKTFENIWQFQYFKNLMLKSTWNLNFAFRNEYLRGIYCSWWYLSNSAKKNPIKAIGLK